MTRNTE